MLVAVLAALALGTTAQPAAAKAPCWRLILNEWTDNNRIEQAYPLHCYREAIAHVPEDLRVYTGIVDDISRARQQMIRNGNVRTLAFNNGKSTARTADTPDRGLFAQGFDKFGSRNVDTVPLPLLILAGLSLLLLAAGGAGLVSRHLRARKAHG